jgi:hypothetical protein
VRCKCKLDSHRVRSSGRVLHIWNGQEAAFRMFTVVGIILLFLMQLGTLNQP